MNKIKELSKLFEHYSSVKLAYYFGSGATGKNGPMSDYDFAVYLDENDAGKRFDIRLSLIAEISGKLGTDKVDLLIMNDIEMPELKYQIIQDGRLIYENGCHKVIVEPLILSEYFDFRHSLKQFGLTKS